VEVVRGGTAILRAEFVDYQGAAIDTTLQSLEIYQPNDVLYAGVPVEEVTRQSAGLYRYDFNVPLGADDGTWRVVWTALHSNGVSVLVGEEEIDVLIVNQSSLNTVPSLRLLINERIPAFGTDADTKFTNDELALILERMGLSLYAAAAEAWYVKAGMYELLIDTDESGSNRTLDQVFKHAVSMGDRYARAFKTEGDAMAGAVEGRVPGIAVSPWAVELETNPLMMYEGYQGYSRYFPIARFVYNPGVMS
jgi:hypothetical protein